MFVSLQVTSQSDMIESFGHGYQHDPPSVSANGKLYQGIKSSWIDCHLSILYLYLVVTFQIRK